MNTIDKIVLISGFCVLAAYAMMLVVLVMHYRRKNRSLGRLCACAWPITAILAFSYAAVPSIVFGLLCIVGGILYGQQHEPFMAFLGIGLGVYLIASAFHVV